MGGRFAASLGPGPDTESTADADQNTWSAGKAHQAGNSVNGGAGESTDRDGNVTGRQKSGGKGSFAPVTLPSPS